MNDATQARRIALGISPELFEELDVPAYHAWIKRAPVTIEHGQIRTPREPGASFSHGLGALAGVHEPGVFGLHSPEAYIRKTPGDKWFPLYARRLKRHFIIAFCRASPAPHKGHS